MRESGTVRNFEIDVLRGFAILLVIFRHSHYALPSFITRYPKILQGTWSGVDLFFVISGFVISLSLIPLIDRCRAGSLSAGRALKSFFVRRVCRLFPLAVLALVSYAVLTLVWNRSGQFGPWTQVRTEIAPVLFYYYNYFVWVGGHSNMSWYWSLSIEEQFYLLYPLLLLGVSSNRIRAWTFVGVILLITFVLRPFTTPDFHSVGQSLWPAYTTPSHLRFDDILAGCLAGLAYTRGGFEKIRAWASRFRGATSAVSGGALVGVSIAGGVLLFFPHPEWTAYPAALVFSFILVAVAGLGLRLTPTLGLPRFVNWLGRRSYCIYLFHMVAIHCVNETWFRYLGKSKYDLSWPQGLASLALALLATFVLAEVLYILVEEPGIRLGRGISERLLSDPEWIPAVE